MKILNLKITKITLSSVIIIFLILSLGDNKLLSNGAQIIGSEISIPLLKHYPISQSYYDDFLSSEEEFTRITFRYYMMIDKDHHDARSQNLNIYSSYDFSGDCYINFTLSDIDLYEGVYSDNDTHEHFYMEIPQNLVEPIFQLIEQNDDFYLNQEEFDGNEYLEYREPIALDIRNHITLSIYNPDRTISSGLPNPKTFIKDWKPGEDPPSEMMPLINYLETVVIPEMRNHPEE